jgi:histidinol-phosphate aminotransferase
MIEARMHGGADDQGPADFDFSTNSNGCGPCPMVLQALADADPTRYPDPRYVALRLRLADLHGVAPERVLLAASASEFIFRVTAWVARRGGRRVWLPAHGYGDYRSAARAWGLSESAQAPDLVWACDPSSPLGQSPEAPPAGAQSVLDLAYAPLRLQGAPFWSDAAQDRFWRLYSPNKALGMTGVRAAYVLAPPHAELETRELESLAPSWLLGAHAVALLAQWCEPQVHQWLAGTLDTLRFWKRAQQALCANLGWAVEPSQANFFVAQVAPSSVDLAGWLLALRAHGVKLREAASFGLPGCVRLAVLTPRAQAALFNAVQQCGQPSKCCS